MKAIPLTQGKVTFVNDEDYLKLSEHRWYAHKIGNTYYAIRNSPRDPLTHQHYKILMHVVILDTPKGMDTDHINGNGLDNRRENLRIATRRENMQNQKNRHRRKTSKYPGVWWSKQRNKWRACIEVNNKQYYLGIYSSEEKAARVYRMACDWQLAEL